jgi:hypothetical protein
MFYFAKVLTKIFKIMRKRIKRKPGAGRKLVEDKRINARVWINRSRVEKLGAEKCSKIGEQAIEIVYQEEIEIEGTNNWRKKRLSLPRTK